MANSKQATNITTVERKQADGFVNIFNPALGNIAIDFNGSEKATEVWTTVRSFDSSDQKAFIMNLIEQSDISIWIRHLDEATKSNNVDNVLSNALASLQK